jgi:hypothetical protein
MRIGSEAPKRRAHSSSRHESHEAVRADNAAYQAAIFDWCDEAGNVFAIGADQDVAVKTAIAAIPESNWTRFRDGEMAETVHCMNKTKKAFRLLVMRRAREQDLFEDHAPYRYHAIASNRSDEDAQAMMELYSRRGDDSQNRIKDLKIGFGRNVCPAVRSEPTPHSFPSAR